MRFAQASPRVKRGLPTSRTEVHLPRRLGKFLFHPVWSRQRPRPNRSTGILFYIHDRSSRRLGVFRFEGAFPIRRTVHQPNCMAVRWCRDRKLPLVLAIKGIAAVPVEVYQIGDSVPLHRLGYHPDSFA
jgi:hypothetical protein